MSKYQGGMIGSVANTTSGTAYTGRANGVFPLPQQIVAKSSSLWAIGQTRPNPPTIGTATATGETTISVAFIPPVQNGGSAITSYTVTSSGGQTATGASSPIVVSGLTTGTSYTFTVTATNALGTSDSSGTSNSVQPQITDPYFSSVSLLLNGDGTNGSTVFTDLSSSPKTITAFGTAQISTAVKKYGTGSIYVNGSSGLYTVVDAGLALSSSDFTIECWLYQVSTSTNFTAIFTTRNTVETGAAWFGFAGGSLTPIVYENGSILTSSISLTLNTWTHFAVSRTGSTLRMFINGVKSGEISYNTTLSSTAFSIGYDKMYSNFFFNGYIDDFRITKGVARYTANFTPPTASFPTM
jgi:hypothetical protein